MQCAFVPNDPWGSGILGYARLRHADVCIYDLLSLHGTVEFDDPAPDEFEDHQRIALGRSV